MLQKIQFFYFCLLPWWWLGLAVALGIFKCQSIPQIRIIVGQVSECLQKVRWGCLEIFFLAYQLCLSPFLWETVDINCHTVLKTVKPN